MRVLRCDATMVFQNDLMRLRPGLKLIPPAVMTVPAPTDKTLSASNACRHGPEQKNSKSSLAIPTRFSILVPRL